MGSKSNESDRELVRRLKMGQIDAFDQLFERYNQNLYRFGRSLLKTHEDAEEVVMEVFLQVWNKQHELQEQKSFKSFLFTLASNAIIDQFRRRAKDQKYEQFLIHQAQQNYLNPEEALEYKNLKKQVEKAIHELPESRKQIYQMSRVEGLSYKEIAQRKQITTKTVENHINLALRHIRKRLEGKDISKIYFLFLVVYTNLSKIFFLLQIHSISPK